MTGRTFSADFPTTPGAFDRTANGGVDAFVTKLNDSGSALVYSTFLGRRRVDIGSDIAVDGMGNAYVTGDTSSPHYPTTRGAFDRTFNGNFDAFVTKLNDSGSALIYSTLLGGTSFDFPSAQGGGSIAVRDRNAYVTGTTFSTAFPTTPGAFDTTYNGGGDAFVTKLPTG